MSHLLLVNLGNENGLHSVAVPAVIRFDVHRDWIDCQEGPGAGGPCHTKWTRTADCSVTFCRL